MRSRLDQPPLSSTTVCVPDVNPEPQPPFCRLHGLGVTADPTGPLVLQRHVIRRSAAWARHFNVYLFNFDVYLFNFRPNNIFCLGRDKFMGHSRTVVVRVYSSVDHSSSSVTSYAALPTTERVLY